MEEMESAIIDCHNSLVSSHDITVHAGDFSFYNKKKTLDIIKRLNGKHIFLRGSHDKWMGSDSSYHEIWEKKIEDVHVVCCHYAMRVWSKSHYGSYQLHGHSHRALPPINNHQYDVGVDCNKYYPVVLKNLGIFKGEFIKE